MSDWDGISWWLGVDREDVRTLADRVSQTPALVVIEGKPEMGASQALDLFEHAISASQRIVIREQVSSGSLRQRLLNALDAMSANNQRGMRASTLYASASYEDLVDRLTVASSRGSFALLLEEVDRTVSLRGSDSVNLDVLRRRANMPVIVSVTEKADLSKAIGAVRVKLPEFTLQDAKAALARSPLSVDQQERATQLCETLFAGRKTAAPSLVYAALRASEYGVA